MYCGLFCGQWVCAFAEYTEIGRVSENTAALAAGHFGDDAEAFQFDEHSIDGGGGEACLCNEAGSRGEWMLLKAFVDPKCRSRSIAFSCDAVPVLLEQIDDPGCGIECLIGCFRNTVQKELQLCFPVAALTDGLQEPIIFGPMGFEVKAEVEER